MEGKGFGRIEEEKRGNGGNGGSHCCRDEGVREWRARVVNRIKKRRIENGEISVGRR